jgi:hypothetical protein
MTLREKVYIRWGILFVIALAGSFPLLIGIISDRTNPALKNEEVPNSLVFYDYTYAILMQVLLVFIGFFFAFLLKREYKLSGYWFELPSTSKK